MVSISVDVPSLGQNLSLTIVKEFARKVRVFAAQNPDFPVGTLLPDALQYELEDVKSLKPEDASLEQVVAFLKEQAVPKSLASLKASVDGLKCSLTTAKTTRVMTIREFISDFSEYADVVEEVAKKEETLNRSLQPMFSKKTCQEAQLKDGKAVLVEVERALTTAEVATARARHFDKVLMKSFMSRISPSSFYKKLDVAKQEVKPRSLRDLMKLARIIAEVEDTGSPVVDKSETTVNQQGKSQGSSGSAGRRSGARPIRPCRHCGEMHMDYLCPTQKRTRQNGGLRANAEIVQAKPEEANVVQEEEALVTTAVVNGGEYRIILDTGASSSFISEALFARIRATHKHVPTKRTRKFIVSCRWHQTNY